MTSMRSCLTKVRGRTPLVRAPVPALTNPSPGSLREPPTKRREGDKTANINSSLDTLRLWSAYCIDQMSITINWGIFKTSCISIYQYGDR